MDGYFRINPAEDIRCKTNPAKRQKEFLESTVSPPTRVFRLPTANRANKLTMPLFKRTSHGRLMLFVYYISRPECNLAGPSQYGASAVRHS
jgi:hypothetical protein